MSIRNKISKYISENRTKYSTDLRGDDRYWLLSASMYLYRKSIDNVLRNYAKGNLLDLGAGNLSSKCVLDRYCSHYTSADIKQNAGNEIDVVCDIHDMNELFPEEYDTVYCSQVLEHCYNPIKALSEIFRILKPGGFLIISVPHLSGLHEEPHDYFRFTPYGLSHLLTTTGYNVSEERRIGGLFSFLSHNVSFIIVALTWKLPVIKWIFWYFNKFLILRLAVLIDGWFHTKNKFPKTILAVARKPI